MLLYQLLKSKIHHARVTYANPDYIGSIEIDAELMKEVGIFNGELVHVWAVDHCARMVTYAFGGPKGVVGLNGGIARNFQPGDKLVIAAFALTDQPVEAKIVLVDEENKVVRHLEPYSALG